MISRQWLVFFVLTRNTESANHIRMKVHAGTKKRCIQCKIVNRGGAIIVSCAKEPSHSQRQGRARRRKAG